MTPKSAFFTLVLCLSLAGCQSYRKSATWETVVNSRINLVEPDCAVVFRKLHGTDFDPKSAMDRGKKRAIEAGGSSAAQS
jgi:hypothetical protein